MNDFTPLKWRIFWAIVLVTCAALASVPERNWFALIGWTFSMILWLLLTESQQCAFKALEGWREELMRQQVTEEDVNQDLNH